MSVLPSVYIRATLDKRPYTSHIYICVHERARASLSHKHKPLYSGIYYRITMFMLFVMVLAALRAVDKMLEQNALLLPILPHFDIVICAAAYAKYPHTTA